MPANEVIKMRATEFIRENVEHFNGLDFSIEIEKDDEYVDDDDTDNQTIYVRAFANGRELGHVLFTIDYDGQGMILKPQDLEVDERFQGQGIAATMYDYVKSKGYKIRRSGQQTDAGAGFWNKHRPEQNVWEGVNRSGVDLEVTELPDEDQILITATSHGKTLGRVYCCYHI
jgi:GNAT superfamily N-acetyltransferase